MSDLDPATRAAPPGAGDESAVPPGARGSLDAIAGEGGRFAIVAIDQRGSLTTMLSTAGLPASGEDLSRFKIDVTRALAPGMSGVLLDPDLGLGPVREAGAVPPGTAVLVTLEAAERSERGGVRRSLRVAGRDGAYVRRVGGAAGKYLLWMRPDLSLAEGGPDPVGEAIAEARAVVEECRAAGVVSVIEALPYPVPAGGQLPADRRAITVETARILAQVHPDLMKLEYPGDAAACRRITEVAGRVPWAVLSAGMAYDRFAEALRVALDAGASGFIAGRTFWQEAASLEGSQRRDFLGGPARARVEACLGLLVGRGRPWRAVAAGA